MNPRLKSAREPAWAGQFYPAHPEDLRRQVIEYLAGGRLASQQRAKALIAPHAGYVYSGAIAGSAFIHLASQAGMVSRVVLVGPSHRVGFEGVALSAADTFTTPLGSIPVEHAFDQVMTAIPQVEFYDEAHAYEHSLEVELPFLQETLGAFHLLPLVVGEATDLEVAAVLERVWGGPETRIVVSSDLSHYLPYEQAQSLDRLTAQAIEALDPERIKGPQACGRLPICGLLRAAARHGLKARTADLRNSGDTAGTRDRVVGYGAFVFTEADPRPAA